MQTLSLQDPLFATYAIAATLMILKAVGMSWLTVYRMMRENAGFLYVLTGPPLWLAQALLYGYVVSRLLHFAAYLSARTHDTRATLWTIGSLILIFMAVRTLLAAQGI